MIRRTTKPGFTLVELLVAMALAVVLLALAIGVSQSSAFDSQKVVGSADRLTEWMIAAKSKALRDKAPRGIRLIPDTANPEIIREIAYIEQPDPIPSNGPMLLGSRLTFYYPCKVTQTTMPQNVSYDFDNLVPQPMAPRAPAGRGLYLTIPTAQLATFTSTVQANDLISIPELRTVLKIQGSPVTSAGVFPPGPNGVTVNGVLYSTVLLNVSAQSLPDLGRNVYSIHDSSTLDSAPHPSIPSSAQPNPTHGTLSVTNFSIIRAARPILGEPTQQLPSGMAVDVRAAQTTSLNPPAADVNGNRDILFAPTGEVIGATEALTVLLVRDANLPNVVAPLGANYDQAGQMILICLYNKTGAIATQPVNPPPSPDPYRFARDGINTGL